MNVRCPRHNDSTPSVTLYPNGAWCHAGCGHVPLTELGGIDLPPLDKETYVEDIDQTMAYIESLPIGTFRGFDFHFDARGYYIVWPEHTYYKLRFQSGKAKYRCPAGSGNQPAFFVRQGVSGTLLCVEGEIEALSIAAAVPEFDVMSPGPASCFGKKAILTHLKPYANVVIVTDHDKAGWGAAIELAALIKVYEPGIDFKILYKNQEGLDFNDLLMQFGKDRLREEFGRMLEMWGTANSGRG